MTTHVVFSVLSALGLAADIATSHVGLGYGLREVGAFGKWTIPVGVGGCACLVFGGFVLESPIAAVCTLLLIPFALLHWLASNRNWSLIQRTKARGTRRVG